jgi:ABC-type nitrate/sulfonate/bicarbonate transport system substrate-binding protein
MNRAPKFGRIRWQAGVALLSATAMLTACGGDGDSGDGGGGGGSDEGVAFSFAMGSSGAQGAFYQEAVERANEKYGYEGEWVELTGSEVAVAGIASGEFHFGAGVAATVMAAQQEQDAQVTFIADFMRMLWTMTGKSDIEGCDDLDGVRFGLHSPGGVSTAIFNAWLAENCEGVEPEILYIEGSPNRLQGLLADQLDATMLEIDDTLELDEDQFHIIVNFSEDLPEIEANTVFANNTFLEEHPEVVENLLAEASALAAEVMEDPQVLADAIREYKPELADSADAIAEAYVDAELFVEDGAMSEEDLTATIELYEVAGAIEDGLTFDQIADRQYLEAALEKD